MDMDNRFAEFLFNRFVEMERKHGRGRSSEYLTIFTNYIEMGFNYRCPENAEYNARKVLSSIFYAVSNWKTHLLDLKGEKAQEVKRRFRIYRERLRALGYTEDEIANLLIEKYSVNNPQEIIRPDAVL